MPAQDYKHHRVFTRFVSPYIVTPLTLFAVALLAPTASLNAVEGSEYYKEGYVPIFNPYPTDAGRKPDRSYRIRYFGPVGIGLDFKRPSMTMEIVNVEEGSPADKTGRLKKGQIIESINGLVLRDIDPRIILGEIITRAEATNGEINLKIRGEGNVLVKIPVMGSYSSTWPVNCPKTDKIVRNLADLLAKEDEPSWGSVLFLLSTGEEKDLAVVRRWMQNIEQVGGITWEIGYRGFGICEYYLRTGDESVLPAIRKSLQDLKDRMYNGGWSGRGAPAAFTYSTGTGQVHASGMYAMNFVLMALLCGVEVDEYLLNETLTQFYRFGGHGNVAYGNGPPEVGFRDNGKTSGLALAMAAAAKISPEGENSVYAMARDNSAMKSFYATNWFHAAHTGGGMGEIWHNAAMALMREKRPVQYRSYQDVHRWVFELSRRHDGSIAIEGMDDRYNRSVSDAKGGRAWGTYFALNYTLPRKALQLWGAPRSQWAQTYPLPTRPWGNAADDLFNSPDPIYIGEAIKLTREDLLRETIPDNASLPALTDIKRPDITEKEMFRYILHPEYGLRSSAMGAVVRNGWSHLVMPLLNSGDPRLRQAGLLTIFGMHRRDTFPEEELTSEMFDRIGAIVEDPNESWWVALHAVGALSRAEPERIGRHRDRLLELLRHDSVWMQTEAVLTLIEIAAEREHYQAVLPPLIATAASFTIDASSWETNYRIEQLISKASPEVKDFAAPFVKEAYTRIPQKLTDPVTGAVMRRGATTVRSRIGKIVQEVPGGEVFARMIPKTTTKAYKSGRDEDMYQYDGKFIPNNKVIGEWIWAVYPAPMSPGEIDEKVGSWVESRLKNAKNGKIELERPKDRLLIKPDGETSKKSKFYHKNFWTGDTIISNNQGHALKMEVRTYEGIDFLIIERSGQFEASPDDDGTEAVPDDWHPGYHVYMRVE